MKTLTQNVLKSLLLLVLMIGISQNLNAATSPLATDLQGLLAEASALDTQLSGATMTPGTFCSDLLHANQAANAHLSSIGAINSTLGTTLTLDADVLQALEDLGAVYVSLGTESIRLSTNLNQLYGTVDQLSIAQGLSAMLRLSDDIGAMADRIGEMADRILVMSDNIGDMADRILLTQEIQNQNVVLTQQNILVAQQNVIGLVSQVDTSKYSTDLLNQLSISTLLETDMNDVVLTAENAATVLASIVNDVNALKTMVLDTDSAISVDSASNTMTINQESLLTLMDMSGKLAALAVAVDGYAIAIDGLNATSATPTFTDSANSILTLSSDIGVMANRIGEEADQILAMADSIGVQADQIVLVQQQQNINIAATQASLLDAQVIIINLLAKYAL